MDSQYGPIPVDFDLATIFLNLEDYVPVLFREHDSPIIRVLDSFEDLLSINMYHSAQSIREIGAHIRRIEQMIDENKGKKELNKITGSQKYLMKDFRHFKPEHTDWEDALNIHILFELPLLPLFIDVFKKSLTYDIEEEWNRKYHRRFCQLTFQPAVTSKHIGITLSFLPGSPIQQNISIIAKFLKDIVNLNEKIKSEGTIKKFRKSYVIDIDNVFQRPYQELAFSILRYITHENLYFEFKSNDEIGISMFSIGGSKNAAKRIQNIYRNVDDSNARSYELRIFRQSLLDLSHRSELLLSLSRILVYDDKKKHLTDIDGFGLGFKYGKLGVLLVEAKDQMRRSSSDSRRHLQRTLEKLNFRTSESPRLVEIEGGAYCYLTIDGNSV